MEGKIHHLIFCKNDDDEFGGDDEVAVFIAALYFTSVTGVTTAVRLCATDLQRNFHLTRCSIFKK